MHDDISSELETIDQVRSFVQRTANFIFDPCAMGAGLKIGMGDMGLIRTVEAQPRDGGWQVSILIRFTGPECLNYFYFKQNLEREISRHPRILSVTVDFCEVFDWSFEAMAPAARAQLHGRTERLRLLAEEVRRRTCPGDAPQEPST
jgi:metal-sulfur cluster biosynthetic enzyme